jgi:hypothetical protein
LPVIWALASSGRVALRKLGGMTSFGWTVSGKVCAEAKGMMDDDARAVITRDPKIRFFDGAPRRGERLEGLAVFILGRLRI